MEITITHASGARSTAGAPLSLEIQRDLYVPADSLRISFPLNRSAREIMFIDVRSHGKRLFTGRIDRQTAEISNNGRILTLSARSSTAVLVDNMLPAQVFEKGRFSDLFQRIAVPLGITGLRGDFLIYGPLRIGAGTSAWSALARACEISEIRRPWVDSNGTVVVGGLSGSGGITFSNQTSKATPFLSARMEWNRHKEISSVVYKDRFDQLSRMITDRSALQRGISRQVVLSSSLQTLNARWYEAKNRLQSSKAGARAIVVETPGLVFCELGTSASVSDPYVGRSGMRVTGIRYSLTSAGERTFVTLWDQGDVY